MFRFLLEVTFIRRVLQIRFVHYAIILTFFGALVAGLIYAVVVFNAIQERSKTNVHHHHAS